MVVAKLTYKIVIECKTTFVVVMVILRDASITAQVKILQCPIVLILAQKYIYIHIEVIVGAATSAQQ